MEEASEEEEPEPGCGEGNEQLNGINMAATWQRDEKPGENEERAREQQHSPYK